jgi:exopolyphosphatase/guanosine-5'-triphosphate,3'-diphosphate pyrophosphatase
MPPAAPESRPADPSRDARGRAQFAAVEKWVCRRLGQTLHEVRVAEIAETVFDLTAPLHSLDRATARLLRLASLVHDVGRAVDEAEHPAHGAAMILSDESLPLSAAERRALAYLTLYHRGAVPAIGEDDVLHPEDDHGRLLKLLGLLRCADGLDSRSLESPRLVFALIAAEGAVRPSLRVTCYLHSDSDKVRRVYQRRKKFRLLEQTLGCTVEVTVARAQGLRMVA